MYVYICMYVYIYTAHASGAICIGRLAGGSLVGLYINKETQP